MPTANASLYIFTPCYGGQAQALYMSSLLALGPACSERGVTLQLELSGGEALIGRGRAAMMAKFLTGDASHLLFVDADIGFQPKDVFRLLDFGAEVAGGIYRRKAPPHDAELGLLAASARQTRDGFETVAFVGTGFMMISRSAAQRMADAYSQLAAKFGDMPSAGVGAVMVFESFTDPETKHYLPDHQAFCHRWRAIGGEVWADRRSGVRHVGALELASP